MHVWTGFEDLPPLVFGPDHEGVHRPLDVRMAVTVFARLSDDFGAKHLAWKNQRWEMISSKVCLHVNLIASLKTYSDNCYLQPPHRSSSQSPEAVVAAACLPAVAAAAVELHFLGRDRRCRQVQTLPAAVPQGSL